MKLQLEEEVLVNNTEPSSSVGWKQRLHPHSGSLCLLRVVVTNRKTTQEEEQTADIASFT